MENKKSKRFSRAQLDIKEQNKITDLTSKIKCMSVPDLEKFPLYTSGDGITKYNHGDVIRYKNGSILYIMENQQTHEKVPTLITVIKDLKLNDLSNPKEKIIKKVTKKKSKKSVKIAGNPILIDSNKALVNFENYYKNLKKKKCIISITTQNFIGKEFFIDKKIPINIINDDGNDSELDYDEEISIN
jgi:hypothetical protein